MKDQEAVMDQEHVHKELYRCLGEAITSRRKRLGMSQDALARSSGVDRSFLSSVENGKRQVSLGAVAKISSGLNMRYTRLVHNCEACERKSGLAG
jgi:transcriptional regulator with XRE-family HTH domain